MIRYFYHLLLHIPHVIAFGYLQIEGLWQPCLKNLSTAHNICSFVFLCTFW